MRASERVGKASALIFAALMSVFGTVCTCGRIASAAGASRALTATAGLAMVENAASTDFDKAPKAKSEGSMPEPDDTYTFIDSDEDTELADLSHDSDEDHTGEDTYLVTESLFRESNMSYGGFYVKNATDLSLDLRGFLNAKLPFSYEETKEPQVLIVHTHATESYMDSDLGYYYESFYPRSTDDKRNIVRVGDAICESLEKEGVACVHCTEHHDDPSYLGAYDNSADSISEYMEKYPSIKIILDIHRDSITTEENEKIKPTFTYGGEKAAQIMIMCGNDNYGYYDFPDWEQNMSLAVKLQSTAENDYPGMTRPLYFGNFMYNMNMAPGSLLIEIGTDANTLPEAVRSGKMLGTVIAKVLKAG